MRIAQLSWAALPTAGGVETHLEYLVDQLRQRGHEIGYWSGTVGASTATFAACLQPGVTDSPLSVRELTAELSGYDVVNVHNPQWHRPAVVDQLLDALSRLPRRKRPTIAMSLHNLSGTDAERTRLKRWLSATACHLIAHSDFVRSHLVNELGNPLVAVLPLCLPPDDPHDTGSTAAATVRGEGQRSIVLQPTRLSAWKGSDLSLTAAVTLLEAGMSFDFVHAGTQQLLWSPGLDPAVLKRAEPWIGQHIRFVHYEPKESWSAIRAADLIVHPTVGRNARGEPYSMSVAQTLIASKPVVVSRSGNLPDLVDGYPLAQLIDAGDSSGLAEAIKSFLTPQINSPVPTDLADVRPTVRSRQLREYHASAADCHLALYEQIASERTAATDGGRQ